MYKTKTLKNPPQNKQELWTLIVGSFRKASKSRTWGSA